MTKISINLLPSEVRTKELKKEKFYKIQFIGIMIVLTVVFLTSLTVALRILQSRNMESHKAELTKAENKVVALRDTQVSLVLLKNRLGIIKQYLGIASNQSSMYRLIDELIPTSVAVNTIAVDRSGFVTFQAFTPDAAIVENLINNLSMKESNEGRITQVSIESVSRGRDGIYRLSFKIKPTS